MASEARPAAGPARAAVATRAIRHSRRAGARHATMRCAAKACGCINAPPPLPAPPRATRQHMPAPSIAADSQSPPRAPAGGTTCRPYVVRNHANMPRLR
jgi:hypothetical protein